MLTLLALHVDSDTRGSPFISITQVMSNKILLAIHYFDIFLNLESLGSILGLFVVHKILQQSIQDDFLFQSLLHLNAQL